MLNNDNIKVVKISSYKNKLLILRYLKNKNHANRTCFNRKIHC